MLETTNQEKHARAEGSNCHEQSPLVTTAALKTKIGLFVVKNTSGFLRIRDILTV